MRKPSGKRLPHGTTLQIVMGAVALLARSGKPVSRAALHQALAASGLTATTIDDRIRVLIAAGHIVRVQRGGYTLAGNQAISPPDASDTESPTDPVLPAQETAPPAVEPIAPAAPPWTTAVSQPWTEQRFDFDQARGRPAKRKRP